MFEKQIINIFVILNLLFFSVFMFIQKASCSDIRNLSKVSNSLARGAQPDVEGFARLKKMGVKTIVNLRDNHSDIEMMKGLGLQYINIPVNPWDLDDKDVVTFLKVVIDLNNMPIFVHCQHGLDKTGTMVAIYRMYFQEMTKEEVFKELPKYGFEKMWKTVKVYLDNIDLKKLKSQIDEMDDIKIEIVK